MRTITAHLLDYTLVNHFESNKSACARSLQIQRTDFNKIYNRCMSGEGNSVTTLEALLRLYLAERYSLDEALAGYLEMAGDGAIIDGRQQEFERKSQIMRQHLADESKAADQRAQLLRSAEHFMAQLERTFCIGNCSACRNGQEACPCQHFCDFVEWIKQKLDHPPDVIELK